MESSNKRTRAELSQKSKWLLSQMEHDEELTERINQLLEQEADEYANKLPWWDKD